MTCLLDLNLMTTAPSPSSPRLLGNPTTRHRRPSLSINVRQYPRFSAVYSPAAERAMAPAPSPSPSSSLYDMLGLPAGATCRDIKAAYRRLARECHPDVVESERKGSSANEFMRIHTAYSTLSDPDKRADYDRRLMMTSFRRQQWSPRPATPYPSSPSFAGYGPRTWETDQCW